jgi:hypothetical protein
MDDEGRRSVMKIVLKIILFPVTVLLSLFVGICRLINQISSMVFMLVAILLSVLALATIVFTQDIHNGLILFAGAFLISPFGLPLIITFLIEVLGLFNDVIKEI